MSKPPQVSHALRARRPFWALTEQVNAIVLGLLARRPASVVRTEE